MLRAATSSLLKQALTAQSTWTTARAEPGPWPSVEHWPIFDNAIILFLLSFYHSLYYFYHSYLVIGLFVYLIS